MTFTLAGNPEFNALLQPAVDLFNAEFGERVQDVTVRGKSSLSMPRRSDGGPSYGFWKSGVREIWLWDEIDEYPVRKTFAHEACHVLDGDWFTTEQRRDILKLIFPIARGWYDQYIDGVKHVYSGLPSEAFAVYASAALGGFDKPAYRSLFDRRVPVGEWGRLRSMALRDYGHAVPEPEPPPEVPTPPDPAQAELDRLNALLAEVSADNTALAAQQLAVAEKAKAELPPEPPPA